MRTLKQSIEERQLEKDMLENDLVNDLREAKKEFTNIYLAELIVEALGDEAKNVRDEMEYFITEDEIMIKEAEKNCEVPGLYKDTYDVDLL